MTKVLVIQNQPTEPIGALGPSMSGRGVRLDCWKAWEGQGAPALDSVDGIVILGGAANPDEVPRIRWLSDEQQLLRQAIDRGLPLMGICLGAELLATLVGARVYRLPKSEIGWVKIVATPEAVDDPIGRILPSSAALFQWHAYGFDLPPTAVPLAHGGASLPAFRYGVNVWGFQFHLDADWTAIDSWIDQYTSDLRRAGLDSTEMRLATEQALGESMAIASSVGRAFLRAARGASQGRDENDRR